MIALLLNLALALAGAHPIHTTVLELRVASRSAGSRGSELHGTLRIFEDDLRAASQQAGLSATDYVLGRLRVDIAGTRATLRACGEQRAADAVLICLRGDIASDGAMQIHDAVLMDHHPDQVNIVRLSGACTTTLLFTTGSSGPVTTGCRVSR